MKTWFTADTHFGHNNIIKYSERPFKSLKIMNDTLIRNWNNRVDKDDLVVFLGDFCFKELADINFKTYLNHLNGHVCFIRGNHDNNNSLNTPIHSAIINIGKTEAYCVHDPVEYSSSYPINLVGHVHQYWKLKKIYHSYIINVGVDVWKYSPVDINEILAVIEEYNKKS